MTTENSQNEKTVNKCRFSFRSFMSHAFIVHVNLLHEVLSKLENLKYPFYCEMIGVIFWNLVFV